MRLELGPCGSWKQLTSINICGQREDNLLRLWKLPCQRELEAAGLRWNKFHSQSSLKCLFNKITELLTVCFKKNLVRKQNQ